MFIEVDKGTLDVYNQVKTSSVILDLFISNQFFLDICFLRLDFETFTITGPDGTVEANGGECKVDTFKITVSVTSHYLFLCRIQTCIRLRLDSLGSVLTFLIFFL